MKKYLPIYFDHAAGTTTSPEILSLMAPYYAADFGNASTLYAAGRNAKKALDTSREKIAFVLHARKEEIFFTGSGTESDNLAILGIARAHKKHGNHILVSQVEHKAVLESAKQLEREGFVVEYIPVDAHGMIDVKDCIKRITQKTILVSVMYANNEIGTVFPIKGLGKAISLKKKKTGYPIFHTDACQAAGYLPLHVEELGVDLLTLNSSKIYGPKGVGVLYKNKNIAIEPIIFGGGQENGLRSGTENIPSIVGCAEALLMVEKRREREVKRLEKIRDTCLSSLKKALPQLVLNGHPTLRLPNNIHISIPEVEGESMVLFLDDLGIQASTGSACSAHDLQVSHVLQAIKQDPLLMHGSLRFTFGEKTTQTECDYLVEVLPQIVNKLRAMSPLPLSL